MFKCELEFYLTFRGAFVKHRQKVSSSGSEGSPQKEWTFKDLMFFLALFTAKKVFLKITS